MEPFNVTNGDVLHCTRIASVSHTLGMSMHVISGILYNKTLAKKDYDTRLPLTGKHQRKIMPTQTLQ